MTKTNKNAAEEFKQTIIDRSTYILEEETEQIRELMHMIEIIVWRLKENDKPYDVQLLGYALDSIYFDMTPQFLPVSRGITNATVGLAIAF